MNKVNELRASESQRMEEESVYREHEMSFATESDFFDD